VNNSLCYYLPIEILNSQELRIEQNIKKYKESHPVSNPCMTDVSTKSTSSAGVKKLTVFDDSYFPQKKYVKNDLKSIQEEKAKQHLYKRKLEKWVR
jgi:hypothetical protein